MESNKLNNNNKVIGVNTEVILNDADIKDTPLPQPQFTILLMVRFAEPVAFTFLFPFIYKMVKDLHVTENENQIAYYVGWIASSFAIAQFCTTLLWGMLSDRWGRKPCILIGLLGTGTSMLLFGFSNSFTWALVTRTMGGALNGNIAIAKSMAAELTDSTNRAKGFAIFPLIFGIGSIFGPIIGGFLYDPTDNLEIIFGDNQFLKNYPAFLPCFVISSLCYICFVFGWFYLEETLPSKVGKLAKYKVKDENNETERLLNSNTTNPDSTTQPQTSSSSSSSTIVESNQVTDQESLKPVLQPSTKWNFSYTTKITILTYTILSLMTVMFDELFATWGPTPSELGGVRFSTYDLALIQSIAGVIIICTTQVYAKFAKKHGVLKLFQWAFIFFCILMFIFPMASLIYQSWGPKVTWWSVLFIYIFRSATGIFLFTSANILVSESAESHLLATVNALAQTFGSLARAVGPAAIGAIFSWSISAQHIFPFDYHLAWYLIGFICFIGAITSRLI
ncbi:MFS general substrate transporter [Conidiobolus coronatus NRRL 28638]|uniref:MFS general substrate transporter n=1 Tax=Conidiobolus coronatus (strain ATCC 28846 / CBS 209.66 / NRRL 28638) TaxID=796925 RepID=A0A137P2R6_CONC2|nr:MFS general substrate transporter [Conidiobolus coronatus NRRL 28638]|eukprot:KXN69323.1 MFS general substrate transporter [Conidiobolus coronatus NRRL 28638]